MEINSSGELTYTNEIWLNKRKKRNLIEETRN